MPIWARTLFPNCWNVEKWAWGRFGRLCVLECVWVLLDGGTLHVMSSCSFGCGATGEARTHCNALLFG